MILTTNAQPQFTPMGIDSGFLYTEMGRAHVSYDTYKIVYYVNLTDFYEMVPKLKTLIDKSSEICTKLNDGLCKTIVNQINNQVDEAELDGSMVLKARRRRRGEDGVCEWCGEIISILTGLEDAKGMCETKSIVKELQTNQQRDHELVKNQTMILKASIDLNSRTFEELGKRFSEMNHTLSQLERDMDFKFKTDKMKTVTHDLIQLATLVLMQHNKLTNKIKSNLEMARKGQLTELIPISSLKNDLERIVLKLKRGQMLPTDIRTENAVHIFRYAKRRAAVYEKIMLIELAIPIAQDETFYLHKATPVPTNFEGHTVTSKIGMHYFLLNTDRTKFIELTNEQVKEGIKMANAEIIYQPTSPVMNSPEGICVWEMMAKPTMKAFMESCDVGYVPRTNYVISIIDNELYYVFADSPMRIWEQCEEGKREYLTIEFSGTIQLKKQCTIHTPRFTLHPHNDYTLKSAKTIIPIIEEITLTPENIDKMMKIKMPPKITFGNKTLLITRMEEYQKLSEKTQELVNHANEEMKWTEFSKRHENLSLFGAIGMGTITIFGVIGCILCIWKPWKRRSDENKSSNTINILPVPQRRNYEEPPPRPTKPANN